MEPMRVRVKSGDGLRDLGEGMYVGDVEVFAVMNDYGTVFSMADATLPPQFVPEGCKLINLAENPRIELDSGETVYGCQVYWEPVHAGAGIRVEVSSRDARSDDDEAVAQFGKDSAELYAAVKAFAKEWVAERNLNWVVE